MSVIEKALRQLNAGASVSAAASTGSALSDIDARAQLLAVVAYIAAVVSVPVDDPARLLWMMCFPIIMSEALGIGYLRLLARSLWVLPLVAVVGIFNPVFDTAPAWTLGSIVISRGWLTFAALLLRGLLSYQALLLLISSCGFYDICRSLRWLRLPAVLVTQLMMLYRYMGVLLQEALNMHRARQARGFGKASYPLPMWGVFAGQLLLRSVDRARRVHCAMLARGFEGTLQFKPFAAAPKVRDWAYLAVWVAIFAALRFVDFTAIASHILHRAM